MSIIDAVIEVHHLLEGTGHAHAFGGALALAHYAEPRGTIDIDVNVFSPETERGALLDALATFGYAADDPIDAVRVAGIRLHRVADPFPLDLFLSLSPAYDEIAARVQRWPFGPDGAQLPFLSAEDLALFKLSFGRDKDWVDLRQMCRSGLVLDLDYVERQLIELRGPTMYPRLVRLRSLTG